MGFSRKEYWSELPFPSSIKTDTGSEKIVPRGKRKCKVPVNMRKDFQSHQSSGEFSISLGPAHVPRLGFKVSAGGSRHCFASYWLDFPPSGLLFCNVIPLLGEECSVSDGSALKGLFLAAAPLSFVSSHFLRFSYGRALDPSIKWYTGTK